MDYVPLAELMDNNILEDVMAFLDLNPEQFKQCFPNPEAPVISRRDYNYLVQQRDRKP